MRGRIIIYLIIGLLAGSCGQYEKLLKSTDFELKKTKAKEYFEDGQYTKASELITQILPRYRATEDAEGLIWMNAQSYFGMKDYLMAGSEFRNYTEIYPMGLHAEEGNFLAAMCDYQMSPRAELDQESTRNAIEGFVLFITRYPSSPKVEDARKYITEMRERLVEKSFNSARLYYNMKQYKAASVALGNSLKEFPDTKYREEMMYLKLDALYQYADNSVPAKQTERYQTALDDYYSFVEEYPGSGFSKDVTRIYQYISKKLKLTTE